MRGFYSVLLGLIACAGLAVLAADMILGFPIEARVASLVAVFVAIAGRARVVRRDRIETLKAVVDAYARREMLKEAGQWVNALRTADRPN